jgi:M6 family metalloprotease-like protein
LNGDSKINLIPPVESKPYIDITVTTLRDFGIEIQEAENTYIIKGNQKYISPKEITIEGNGFTIDANKTSRIFNVTSTGVVFKNIIFTNGHAEGNGGAISGSATAIGCTFNKNYANGDGGAVYNVNTEGCTFSGNCAEYRGGGIYNGNAINCTFTDNNYAGQAGGGMHTGDALNCIFTGNGAKDQGAAMYGGNAFGCTFENNNADNHGAAISNGNAVNCTFTRNHVNHNGGGIYNGNATDCNFKGNEAFRGGGIYNGIATNCMFVNNVVRETDDDDGDGEVDNVFVFFAGGDEAEGAGDDCIWSHAWYIKDGAGRNLVLDGKTINRYACTSELTLYRDAAGKVRQRLAGIGSFCHEYSHTFDLPDMYDTDYESSGGHAEALWVSTSLMDGGNYNNLGSVPPNFNAVERELLGLSEPVVIEQSGVYTLEPVNKGGQCYRINTEEDHFLSHLRSIRWNKTAINFSLK